MSDVNKCGFKPCQACNDACKYFKTCTRNPLNRQTKAGKKDGIRKEWVDKTT